MSQRSNVATVPCGNLAGTIALPNAGWTLYTALETSPHMQICETMACVVPAQTSTTVVATHPPLQQRFPRGDGHSLPPLDQGNYHCEENAGTSSHPSLPWSHGQGEGGPRWPTNTQTCRQAAPGRGSVLGDGWHRRQLWQIWYMVSEPL